MNAYQKQVTKAEDVTAALHSECPTPILLLEQHFLGCSPFTYQAPVLSCGCHNMAYSDLSSCNWSLETKLRVEYIKKSEVET